ncbi:MAG: PH domain-containing protein [Micropruina sp.]|nr:MAG: PH domain-containing protein [Micropruina sp.]
MTDRPPGGAREEFVARPHASLRMAISLSVSLIAASLLGWQLTPLQIRALFTPLQIATLVFFVLLMVAIMLAVGLSIVRADERGLRFRNGVRRHEIPWADVKAFRFRPGDPWAFVLLRTELEQLPLMGIQRTDGQRAHDLVADLRARLEAAYRGRAS